MGGSSEWGSKLGLKAINSSTSVLFITYRKDTTFIFKIALDRKFLLNFYYKLNIMSTPTDGKEHLSFVICGHVDAPMRLPVSGIYKIKGVGDVVAGRIEQGTLVPNSEVIFLPMSFMKYIKGFQVYLPTLFLQALSHSQKPK